MWQPLLHPVHVTCGQPVADWHGSGACGASRACNSFPPFPRHFCHSWLGRESMRSIRLLAVATTVLVVGSACGGDDPPTNGGENEAPVASFTAPTNCVAGVACNFTSTSTDDEGISTYSWDFDAAGTAPNATTQSASFTFAAAGTYPVSLTVTDGEGLTHSVTNNVIVAAAPV